MMIVATWSEVRVRVLGTNRSHRQVRNKQAATTNKIDQQCRMEVHDTTCTRLVLYIATLLNEAIQDKSTSSPRFCEATSTIMELREMPRSFRLFGDPLSVIGNTRIDTEPEGQGGAGVNEALLDQ